VRQSPQQGAFCVQYVAAVEHSARSFLRRPIELPLRLFLFDAFTWHFDRTPNTPNVIWSEGGMYPIDHARAFFEIERVDESGCRFHDYDSHHPDKWSTHLALQRLRTKRRRPSRAQIDDILGEVADRSRGGVSDILGRWPLDMGPLGFRDDVVQFLKARLSRAESLAQQVYDAISR
jgi:hypothetical protein